LKEKELEVVVSCSCNAVDVKTGRIRVFVPESKQKPTQLLSLKAGEFMGWCT